MNFEEGLEEAHSRLEDIVELIGAEELCPDDDGDTPVTPADPIRPTPDYSRQISNASSVISHPEADIIDDDEGNISVKSEPYPRSSGNCYR